MIVHDDCFTYLKTLPDNSIDSLITDPPAGISFMNKEWDDDKGGRDNWIKWLSEIMKECLRVMKPGAHGLVWALPRTSHWTATALEDAGFEIRDVVTHLFGTGFPKSLDISKAIDKSAGAEREVVGEDLNQRGRKNNTGIIAGQAQYDLAAAERKVFITAPATDEAKHWQGWGTALKPASEHWILIRKPLSEKTVAKNVLKHGTGGINIDGCRIDPIGMDPRVGTKVSYQSSNDTKTKFGQIKTNMICGNPSGRFPANLVLDEEAAQMLDEKSGVSKSTGGGAMGFFNNSNENNVMGSGAKDFYTPKKNMGKGDVGGASRFFYVAKVSPSERGDSKHPTQKSIKLMSYLIKLITPPGGTVLDPFMGSGTTGVASKSLAFEFVGIEKEQEYFIIAQERLL